MGEDLFRGPKRAFEPIRDHRPQHAADLPLGVPKFIAAGATGGEVRMADKQGRIIMAHLEPGQVSPFRPVRIYSTGTTVTPINAGY